MSACFDPLIVFLHFINCIFVSIDLNNHLVECRRDTTLFLKIPHTVHEDALNPTTLRYIRMSHKECVISRSHNLVMFEAKPSKRLFGQHSPADWSCRRWAIPSTPSASCVVFHNLTYSRESTKEICFDVGMELDEVEEIDTIVH